jgi:hypothetical protein
MSLLLVAETSANIRSRALLRAKASQKSAHGRWRWVRVFLFLFSMSTPLEFGRGAAGGSCGLQT